jgi:hypothetical protein
MLANATPASSPSFFELVGCRFYLGRQAGAECFFLRNLPEQLWLSST